jgi:hypothetical protein
VNGNRAPRRRPRVILPAAVALGLLLGFAGWMIFRRSPPVAAPEPESVEEAAASAKTNDALVMRPWELWKRKVTKPE